MLKRKKTLTLMVLLTIVCLFSLVVLMPRGSPLINGTQIPLEVQDDVDQFFPETLANNYTSGDQQYQSISALNETTFVIAWTSDGQDTSNFGVYATVFDNTGKNLTSEFRVNSYITNNQYLPSVTAFNDTTFVVVWQGEGSSDNIGIFGKVFDSTGTNLTDDIRLNADPAGGQYDPAASRLDETSFVVVWRNFTAAWDIVANVFDSTCASLTTEVIVDATATFTQQPRVSSLNETFYAVTWTSDGQDGDGDGVFATVMDASTNVNITNEFQVNVNTTGAQNDPAVCGLTETTFAVAWVSNGQDGDGDGVYVRLFDNTGSNLTNEFLANFNYTTSHQQNPSLTRLTDTTFMAAWDSAGQDPTFDMGAYARIFSTTGANVTNEFRVNDYTTDIQGLTASCQLNTTNFVITWMSSWQDLSQRGVYFRGFSFADDPPQSNAPSDASYIANSTGNTINWTLTDDKKTGNYTVLKNGSEHVPWSPWNNDTNLQVPVDTDHGFGVWNYTILFNDSLGTMGTPDSVFITITDYPPTSNSPSDATYTRGASVVIPWVMTDDAGTGWCRVLRNGQFYQNWVPWLNGTSIDLIVDTNTVGTFNYTLEFNDSNGNWGVNDTVVITIQAPAPPPPIPGFEFFIVLLCLGMVLGIAFTLRRRNLFHLDR